MVTFLKLCIIWLVVGLMCAAIAALYDIVINRVYIDKRGLKAMFLMIIMGFISVPVTIFIFVEDIKDNKKYKKRNKKVFR